MSSFVILCVTTEDYSNSIQNGVKPKVLKTWVEANDFENAYQIASKAQSKAGYKITGIYPDEENE